MEKMRSTDYIRTISIYERTEWMKDVKWMVKNFFAEMLGTLVLILLITGGAFSVINSSNNVLVPLANPQINPIMANLTLAVIVFFSVLIPTIMFIKISGAHFNPVVSLAALCYRRIDFWTFLTYLVAQVSGSIVGSAILYGLIPSSLYEDDGVPPSPPFNGDDLPMLMGCIALNPYVGVGAGLGVEIILSFIAIVIVLNNVMVVLPSSSSASTKAKKGGSAPKNAAFLISATYAALTLLGGWFTGAAINPLRHFGPAVISNFWPTHVWIYWVGPFVGGVVAIFFYSFFFYTRDSSNGISPPPKDELVESERVVVTKESLGTSDQSGYYPDNRDAEAPPFYSTLPRRYQTNNSNNNNGPKNVNMSNPKNEKKGAPFIINQTGGKLMSFFEQ